MKLPSYIKNIRSGGGRCFTIEDVINQCHISRTHARVALHQLLNSGDLVSPARGFYVIVPPEYQPYGSIPAEELVPLVMQHWRADYYVALLSAGLFYGATHQKPGRFQVISNRRIKSSLVFGSVEINFIYKKSLLNLPTKSFPVSTGNLIVSSPELIVLDLFLYLDHSGGLNHIATVLSELLENLDPIKLINLAKQMGAERQLQRIGYILDNIEHADEASALDFIERLALCVKENNKRYIALAPEISSVGFPRCKKWRVVVNTDIESDL